VASASSALCAHALTGCVGRAVPCSISSLPAGRWLPPTRQAEIADPRPRAEIERDIEETLGLVPTFFDRIPDEFLAPEWTLFMRLELEETRIPSKYKELIGVALHSETKCRYCTLFPTEAAKMFGATEEEIQEAVHYAKHSLGWSAYLNGMRVDYNQFAEELQRIGEHMAARA
jgi:AhpD family alkylhydroperoxidase